MHSKGSNVHLRRTRFTARFGLGGESKTRAGIELDAVRGVEGAAAARVGVPRTKPAATCSREACLNVVVTSPQALLKRTRHVMPNSSTPLMGASSQSSMIVDHSAVQDNKIAHCEQCFWVRRSDAGVKPSILTLMAVLAKLRECCCTVRRSLPFARQLAGICSS